MSGPGAGRTRLGRNIAATYASQAWVTLAGIVFVPLYLAILGPEAYGLVGIYAILQASFALLDLGLTRTVSRETARVSAGTGDVLEYRRLVRALGLLFLAVAVAGAIALLVLAGPLADHWLRNRDLPEAEVRLALQVMGLAIAFRWMGGLYRGILVGAERIAWLGGYNAAAATVRQVGVFAAILLVAPTPTVFFGYQFLVALAELLGLAWQAHRQLPPVPAGTRLGWSLAAVRPHLAFSASIAVTSAIWVLVTQADKVVLSRLLLLEDYGHFTLGVLVAGAVLVVTNPIATPLLPRLAHLEARGEADELQGLYRGATQLVCVLAFSSAATLAAFAEPILWAWTGDAAAVRDAAPILALYASGNAILTVAAFPFYLQYAKGDLRLHLWGNLAFILVLVPAIVAATLLFGAIGAGWVWLGSNAAYLLSWVPVIHHRFAPGLHRSWFAHDVLLPLAATASAAALLHAVAPAPADRLAAAAVPLSGGLVVLAAGIAASPAARRWLAARTARWTA